MFDALRTHVVGPLACMTPKNILDHIVLVQLVLVIELWVVSSAFVEEGLQLWDVVSGLRSSKLCPPASQPFVLKISNSEYSSAIMLTACPALVYHHTCLSNSAIQTIIQQFWMYLFWMSRSVMFMLSWPPTCSFSTLITFTCFTFDMCKTLIMSSMAGSFSLWPVICLVTLGEGVGCGCVRAQPSWSSTCTLIRHFVQQFLI